MKALFMSVLIVVFVGAFGQGVFAEGITWGNEATGKITSIKAFNWKMKVVVKGYTENGPLWLKVSKAHKGRRIGRTMMRYRGTSQESVLVEGDFRVTLYIGTTTETNRCTKIWATLYEEKNGRNFEGKVDSYSIVPPPY